MKKITFTAEELINGKIKTETLKNLNSEKLSFNGSVVAEDEKTTNFFVNVLKYLSTEKEVNIKEALGGLCNEDGSAIYKESAMRKIKENLFVEANTSTSQKFNQIKACFEKLNETEDLSLYKFELEKSI